MSYKGVRVRNGKIQIKFKPLGEVDYCYKTLEGWAATPANEHKASKLREQIRLECRFGTFRWGDHFPDDSRAQQLTAGSFHHFAQSWLDNPENHWTKRTRYKWKGILSRVWNPSLHDRPIAQITYDHITKALSGAMAEFSEQYAKEPSASTYNDWLTCLRGPFDMAVKARAISRHKNPCDEISNTKRPKPLPDPFSSEEIEAIVVSMYEHEEREHAAYVEFCFFSGVRSPSEPTALFWPEISFSSQEARICRKRTKNGVEDGTKTGDSRLVDLNSRSEHALKAMREITGFRNEEVFVHPGTGTPIISTEKLNAAWTRTLKRLKIRYRRMYNMRSSYACHYILEGLNPAYLANQMGHTLDEFFKSYARWIEKADKGRQAAQMRDVTPEWGKTASKPTLVSVND